MKNIPYDYFYLGLSLGLFTDLTPFNWKLYAIGIPFIILNTIKNKRP